MPDDGEAMCYVFTLVYDPLQEWDETSILRGCSKQMDPHELPSSYSTRRSKSAIPTSKEPARQLLGSVNGLGKRLSTVCPAFPVLHFKIRCKSRRHLGFSEIGALVVAFLGTQSFHRARKLIRHGWISFAMPSLGNRNNGSGSYSMKNGRSKLNSFN